MQFRYIGEPGGSETNKKILEQFEAWSLEALVDVAKQDIDEAARMFGTTPDVLVTRFEKHGLLSQLGLDK